MTSRARVLARHVLLHSRPKKKTKKLYTSEIKIPSVLIRMFYGNGNILNLLAAQHQCTIKFISPEKEEVEYWALNIYCRTRIGLRAAHSALVARLNNTLIIMKRMHNKK